MKVLVKGKLGGSKMKNQISSQINLDNSVDILENNSDTREGYINVTGGKVWFRVVGADKKGYPLLLLHGGPGAPHDSLEIFNELKNERPVIFYDQLGCGNSERPQNNDLWTAERFVEEVSQVVHALGLKKIHIWGHSWGSMLAVAYILKYEGNIISCILSGPYLCSKRFISDARECVRKLPKKYRDLIMKCEETGDFDSGEYQKAMKYFDRQYVLRSEKKLDCVVKGMSKFGAEVYKHMWGPSEFTATGTLKDYSLVERLHEIKIPTFFVSGRYDEVSPETVKYYQSKIKGSKMKVIEDASHCTYNERPQEHIEIMRNFLYEVEKKNEHELDILF